MRKRSAAQDEELALAIERNYTAHLSQGRHMDLVAQIAHLRSTGATRIKSIMQGDAITVERDKDAISVSSEEQSEPDAE